MAAQANLVLNNGAATPVAKTFVPKIPYGGPNQAAVWELKEGVAPIAYPRVEMGQSRTSNSATKSYCRVTVPYVTNDAVAGPKKVAECLFDSRTGGFIVPDIIPDTTRADFYAFVKNALSSSVMYDFVYKNEGAY